MAVLHRKEEKIQAVLGRLPKKYNPDDFVAMFIKLYSKDWGKIKSAYIKASQDKEPGTVIHMPKPELYLKQVLEIFLTQKPTLIVEAPKKEVIEKKTAVAEIPKEEVIEKEAVVTKAVKAKKTEDEKPKTAVKKSKVSATETTVAKPVKTAKSKTKEVEPAEPAVVVKKTRVAKKKVD